MVCKKCFALLKNLFLNHCYSLLGTKIDLQPQIIKSEEGRKLAQRIGAYSFLECSAKTDENVKEVIIAAIKAAVGKIPAPQMRKIDIKDDNTSVQESGGCCCCDKCIIM